MVGRAAERAAPVLGLEIADLLRVRPYEAAENRYLYVMSKVRDTPPRFPSAFVPLSHCR